MPKISVRHRSTLPAIVALVASLQLGCFAYGKTGRDIDRTPVVDTGTAATIIYPGQSVPFQPRGLRGAYAAPAPGRTPGTAPGASSGSGRSTGTGLPPAAGPGPAPSGGTGESAQPAPARGSAFTMIGGAEKDEVRHEQHSEEPTWVKSLMLPFALLAAPFKALMDEDETEAGPAIPRPSTVNPEPPLPERTAAPANDYESQVVRRLEQELEQRGRAPVGTPATPPVRVASSPHRLSIAEELARLESAPIPRSRPRAVESDSRQPAPAPAPEAHSPHRVTASGVVDRDGDGNIDHWIYRADGEIAREEFDDDADGRTDRALQYDLTTHQISRVEEDADRDGTFDTWTDYRNGAVVRRRADADDDGVVDTWSFYDGGEMTRHEQDVNGDGFRDRVSFFRSGQLVREERDLDGDGQRDVATHYDAARRITLVEEDTTGDGSFDVISHYDEGRLSRRELLGDAAEVN